MIGIGSEKGSQEGSEKKMKEEDSATEAAAADERIPSMKASGWDSAGR